MVHHISRTMIKPSPFPESIRNQHCHLTSWGLKCLSTHYIQWGLLFADVAGDQVIDQLKASLSTALYHSYPLAGRLKTEKKDGGMFVFLDVNGGEGVEFIRAIASNVTTADVANDEVFPLTHNFFALNGAVGCDGHFLPLFAT